MAERSVHIRIAVRDLEAARARLASLGVEGEEALSKIERAAPRAAAGLDQVDRAVARAGRNSRFALGNAAAQIQDVVVSLQAGQRPLTVLIQQGSQFASAWGPVGVVLGTVTALALTGVSAWLALRDSQDGATASTENLDEALSALDRTFAGSLNTVDDAIERYRELTDVQRELERLDVSRGLRDIEAQMRAQAEAARESAEQFANLLRTAQTFASDPESILSGESSATFAVMARDLEAGSLSLKDFVIGLRQMVAETPNASQQLLDLDAALAGNVEALERLRKEAEDGSERLRLLGEGAAEGARTTKENLDIVNGLLDDFKKGQADAARSSKQAADQAGREAEQRAKTIAELAIEADQVRRLAEAKQESEQAARAVEIAIAGENAARKLGADASEEQRQAVAAEAAETQRLKFVIQETDQARRQSAQLISNIVRENERFFETLEKGEAAAQRSAAAEAKRTREQLAKEAQEDFERPFENAAQNIQNTMTDTFENIYSGGVTNFEDLAESITQIFTRLAAELTTLLILRPQLLMGGGVGGAGSSLASQLGFAGAGAAGVGAVGVPNLAAGTPTSTPVTGPGGMLVGGGVTSSSGAPAPPPSSFFGPGVLGAGLAGVGVGTVAGGLIGGSQVGSLLGSTAGAIAGGAIGSAIPIIGTAIGAFAGGALGGLIGGFFGGGNGSPGAANNTGRLSFGTTAGAGGPFGRVAIGGDSDFVSALAPMIAQFDEGVAEFLTTRQEDAIGQALQALEEFTGRFPEADPSKAFQAIIEQRTRTVLQTGFPGISADAVLEGNTGVEDIARRLQTALQTQQQINELTQAQDEASKFARSLEEVRERFRELRDTAKEFGISTKGLAAAQRAEIEELREARRLERQGVAQELESFILGQTAAGQFTLTINGIVDQVARLRAAAVEWGLSTEGLTAAMKNAIREVRAQRAAARNSVRQEIESFILQQTGGGQFKATINAIVDHVERLRTSAEEWGLSTEGLTEAMNQAIRAARAQREEEERLARQRREQLKREKQELALSIPARFDALADPLTALRTQIRFENKNPTQQFEAARKDFERLVRQSERGNLEAIAQLPGAAQLFRDLAGRFGASPLQAEVDKQILRSITDVLSTVREAQQEASRGMVGAINRAERAIVDTLQELIAESRETRREIRRLGREARVA